MLINYTEKGLKEELQSLRVARYQEIRKQEPNDCVLDYFHTQIKEVTHILRIKGFKFRKSKFD